MNTEHAQKLVKQFEKPAYKSKKFIAFFFMELLLGALAIIALITQPDLGWPLALFMSLVVVTMGAIALTFNGFQASLDKYFRGAALLGNVVGDAVPKITEIVPTGRGFQPVPPGDEDEDSNEDGEA